MTRWVYGIVVLATAGLVAGVAPARVSGQSSDERQAPRAEAPRAGRERVQRHAAIVNDGGGRLGVSLRDVETADVSRAKLPDAVGALVDEVEREGAAEKAGIKAGDVIVEFDGERVRSARQLSRLVRETPAGRTVKAAVVRDGARQVVSVTPAAADNWSAEMDRAMAEMRDTLRAVPRHFEFDFDHARPPAPPDAPRPPRAPRRPRLEVWAGGPRLGISVQPLTDQLATYFGAREGVLVASVEEGSAAAKAGVKAGDVITSIDGHQVTDPRDVARELRNAAGREVSIGLVREKKTMTLKATVEPRRPPGGRPA